MSGLREDRQERSRLVEKINALFSAVVVSEVCVVSGRAVESERSVVSGFFGVNGLSVVSGLAPRWAAKQP